MASSSEQTNTKLLEDIHNLETTNNDKIKKFDNSGTIHNENKITSHSNQTSLNNSSSNILSSNNQSSIFNSNSRENLVEQQSTNQHSSHNNLINFTNDSCLSSSIANSSNINALDLPTNRDTYKNRKKIYQLEKKKLAEQLLLTLNDPTVIVLADYLKVRATFKAWSKVWCELRPGLLVIYKSQKVHKSGQWIGTVLLNICTVLERPSKKDGFCFKLFNVQEQNIWAKTGPKGESFGALTLPLPLSYLMFRCTSKEAGNTWIKAINLSLQCSKQMIRNDLNCKADFKLNSDVFNRLLEDEDTNHFYKNEHEIEKEHFNQDLTDDQNSSADYHERSTDSDTTSVENDFKSRNLTSSTTSNKPLNKIDSKNYNQQTIIRKHRNTKVVQNDPLNLSSQSSQHESLKISQQLIDLKPFTGPDQTEYIYQPEDLRFGATDETSQSEDNGEDKSLLWSLLKQVRPGDLSKVVLPTFILEPRSFLDKLSDYYYHCDILANATIQNDPFLRMKEVVRWYLSGFYKKPQGLKKPYNSILGEQFRCYWTHKIVGDEFSTDETKKSDQFSKTFYVAEQVSHHPPISAWYCVNRHQGYQINGAVCVHSSYYGNSVSAILTGNAKLSLINRGEDYILSFPYCHCKGILFGSLTFELGGKIEIKCEKTNYTCDLEFKLKPFLGGEMNVVYGKIKLNEETIATITGKWDKEIVIKEKRTENQSILWKVDKDTYNSRLKRFIVPLENQSDNESQKLWAKVSDAIKRNDQKAATEEKTKLEDQQRKDAKYRLENNVTYQPKLFQLDPLTNQWYYKYEEDKRPWDNRTDIVQFEKSFIIQTLTKHRKTMSKTNLTNINLSPTLSSNHNCLASSNYSTNLTPLKTNIRKRSPNSNKKLNSTSLEKCENEDQNTMDRIFDYIDGIDEEEDTDYSSTFKDSLSNCKNKSLNLITSKLFKKIEKNENNFNKSLNNLKNRQTKLEQIMIEDRKHKKLNIMRTISNSQFFSLSNILTLFLLTIVIQLIIYKFNNNYLRK